MGNNCLPTTMPAFKTIACRLVALLALFVTGAYVFLDPSLVGFCHTEIVMTQISSANPVPVCKAGSQPVPAWERFIGTALGVMEPGLTCQDEECGQNIELSVGVALVIVLLYLVVAFREVKLFQEGKKTAPTPKPVASEESSSSSRLAVAESLMKKQAAAAAASMKKAVAGARRRDSVGDFSSGLFSCSDDCGSCLAVFCCLPFTVAQLFTKCARP